jgi:hypothetical protein
VLRLLPSLAEVELTWAGESGAIAINHERSWRRLKHILCAAGMQNIRTASLSSPCPAPWTGPPGSGWATGGWRAAAKGRGELGSKPWKRHGKCCPACLASRPGSRESGCR